ncbi:MAG: cytochrome P450, partial [Myxococcales bacterium]|nr:cytochrome P450 [Myxococcales bacterium]
GRMTDRTAPQPAGLPVLGQFFEMRANPLQLLVKTMCEQGGVARLVLGPRTLHLVTHPDYVQEVLQHKHRAFTKQTPGFAQLRLVVGYGLVTSDGDFWRRQRRITQPAFHKQRLAGFGEKMIAIAHETGNEWAPIAADSGVLDVDREMMRATLRIVSETMLSADLSKDAAEVAEALDLLLADVRARTTQPLQLPLAVPTPGNIKFRRALATLDRLIHEVIETRRAGRERRDDLLQMFLDAVDDETGERMTNEQLRDEVVTVFIAGHETTANALAWCWYLLSKHPLVRERVWDELDRVLDGRSPTLDDLPKLTYLGQVFDETLRLYPPAWLFARQTCEAVEVGGYTIPDDSTVLISPYAIHRSPEFWDNPLGFDPDRFAPERVAEHHRYQFIPFGAGNRMCIGKGFAVMEAKLILAELCRRFCLDLLPDHPVRAQPAVTLRPADGIWMRVRERVRGASS